ncbi:MAG TPA: calcium/sodium antiporter [Oceanospirillaceae bacterium]|nr:calcium/sodium antiporter [Oceanospirillaceae bacterium]
MLVAALAVLLGLGLLIWSADRFVDGAAATASHLGMSPMLIGLTVIAFGTSAPEILVSATAAWNQVPGLAVGNAIGSNIANIALVLGATALIAPLPIRGSLVRAELPILTVATIGAGVLLLDQYLGLMDGVLLLAGLALSLYLFKRYQEQHTTPSKEDIPDMTLGRGIFWLVLGLLVLGAGSRILVWGATDIAIKLGVSDLIIGLTVVAIGTSLPELAATIASARKGQHAMAIGNIIGSNMFNLLAVMALPGLIYPAEIAAGALWRDYSLMLTLTLILFGMGFRARRGGEINRTMGFMLLLIYTLYMIVLYVSAQS